MTGTITLFNTKNLSPSPLNPRKDLGDLTEMRQSIISKGVLQPLIVRPNGKKDHFEIVAGHRRHAASLEAVKNKELPKDWQIPAIIRDLTDEEAVEVMYIENLIRENLSPYDEAVLIRDYVDKQPDDPTVVTTLADKIGVSPRYIRRRLEVMRLPKEVLDLWHQGTLSYGHMELCLGLDPEVMNELLDAVVRFAYSVGDMKNQMAHVNTPLKMALFSTKQEGCTKCKHSTKVQRSLFGDDFSDSKAACTKQRCFYEKQTAWLNANWKEMDVCKEAKTNNIVISDSYNDVIAIHRSDTPEACLSCEHYVTHFRPSGMVASERACKGSRACYNGIMYGQKQTAMPQGSEKEIKDAKRAENLGRDASEEFFKEKLPAAIEDCPHTDAQLRIILSCLARIDSKAHDMITTSLFKEQGNGSDLGGYYTILDIEEKLNELDEAALYGLLISTFAKLAVSHNRFLLSDRVRYGQAVDLILDRDFVMNEAFLKRKSKASLIKIGIDNSLIKSHTIAEMASMKKTAIIDMIKDKDLSGIIPPEIAAVMKPAAMPMEEEIIDCGEEDDCGEICNAQAG